VHVAIAIASSFAAVELAAKHTHCIHTHADSIRARARTCTHAGFHARFHARFHACFHACFHAQFPAFVHAFMYVFNQDIFAGIPVELSQDFR
jgi:hypothetical protein